MKHGQPKTMSDHDRKGHDRLKVIADLLEQSLTPAEIGRQVGLSEGWVKHLACAHGLTKPAGVGKRPLSRRQAGIMAFLQDYTAHHPYPPTMREITAACRISSTSVTDYNLRRLEHGKYLTRKPGIARGMVLTERGRSWLPVLPQEAA